MEIFDLSVVDQTLHLVGDNFSRIPPPAFVPLGKKLLP